MGVQVRKPGVQERIGAAIESLNAKAAADKVAADAKKEKDEKKAAKDKADKEKAAKEKAEKDKAKKDESDPKWSQATPGNVETADAKPSQPDANNKAKSAE